MAASEATSIPALCAAPGPASSPGESLRVTPATPFKAGFRQCSSARIPIEVLPTRAFACGGVTELGSRPERGKREKRSHLLLLAVRGRSRPGTLQRARPAVQRGKDKDAAGGGGWGVPPG